MFNKFPELHPGGTLPQGVTFIEHGEQLELALKDVVAEKTQIVIYRPAWRTVLIEECANIPLESFRRVFSGKVSEPWPHIYEHDDTNKVQARTCFVGSNLETFYEFLHRNRVQNISNAYSAMAYALLSVAAIPQRFTVTGNIQASFGPYAGNLHVENGFSGQLMATVGFTYSGSWVAIPRPGDKFSLTKSYGRAEKVSFKDRIYQVAKGDIAFMRCTQLHSSVTLPKREHARLMGVMISSPIKSVH